MVRNKTLDAQLHIIINKAVKIYNCDSYTCRVMHDKRLHAECMVLIGNAQNKTSGAQLHMIVNISVMFHDCGSHTF
jgi:pyruvate-formate lyase